jgi:hypothetical protein
MDVLPAFNPFHGSVLPDARHDPEGDVERINADAFDACLKAVEQARTGRQSASVLLNGVPGSGKTHLLARLRVHLESRIRRDPQAMAMFVYVRLDTTPRRLWRHLKEQVVEDLRREIDCRCCLERLLDLGVQTSAPAQNARNADGISDLLDQSVKDRNLAIVLTHLLLNRHRLEARAWLRGDSLPESVLDRLGVATSDPDRLRRGPQDAPRDIQVPLAPSGSRRVIPVAATVLRSLALLRYRSRASSHNDLTPLQGYRGLLASIFDLPWLVDSKTVARQVWV